MALSFTFYAPSRSGEAPGDPLVISGACALTPCVVAGLRSFVERKNG